MCAAVQTVDGVGNIEEQPGRKLHATEHFVGCRCLCSTSMDFIIPANTLQRGTSYHPSGHEGHTQGVTLRLAHPFAEHLVVNVPIVAAVSACFCVLRPLPDSALKLMVIS